MTTDPGYALTSLSMSDRMRAVTGSAALDTFRQLHKVKLPRWHFAVDGDFFLIEKNPRGVVALLDIKCGETDGVTFGEVILYNWLAALGLPIYIVTAPSMGAIHSGYFVIEQYLGGDPGPQPPRIRKGPELEVLGWGHLEQWESDLRADFKRRMAQQTNGGVW